MIIANNGSSEKGKVTLNINVISLGPNEFVSIFRNGQQIATNLPVVNNTVTFSERVPAGTYSYQAACGDGTEENTHKGTPYVITLVEPQTVLLPPSITYGLRYGPAQLQYVNLYKPAGVPRGIIMRIHGGSWRSDADSVSLSSPNSEMTTLVDSGYAVVDVNYRGWNTDNAPGGGEYPNNVNDIKTALRYCLVNGAGSAAGYGNWQSVYEYINSNGGLMVYGGSAGGHLAIMGVCEYGTSSGVWPLAVVSAADPLNLDYNSVFIDPALRTLVIDKYVTNPSLLTAASPYYQYGSSSSPGPWFSAVNNSSCKFHFTQNNNDTLVTNEASLPTIQNFKTYNSSNTTVNIVNEGPPKAMFAGLVPVTQKGITTDGTTATLPLTGNSYGDSWLVTAPVVQYWVFNGGTYAGDAVNPASINGFTRWFDHNYIDSESSYILNVANSVFA